MHRLDVVLADAPCPPGSGVKAFNHLLGECSVTFFATRRLGKELRAGFPGSLDGAPLLLPSAETALGRAVRQWFESEGIRPNVVGEFDDSALMKAFGQSGLGAFPMPSVSEADVKKHYGAEIIGRADTLRARFYAISPERRLKNPAVVAICETAREAIFS